VASNTDTKQEAIRKNIATKIIYCLTFFTEISCRFDYYTGIEQRAWDDLLDKKSFDVLLVSCQCLVIGD
jgi:hypothetical protein